MKLTVTKEISSEEKRKESFLETAFRCANATHRVTPLSSVFILLTQFSENLQWDTSERNETYGDKGNILRWQLERRSLRNFLVMCQFISRITLLFHAAVHYHCLWGTWEGLLWIPLRPTLIKEISSVQNVKEAFWETSLLSVNSSHIVTTYFSGISLLTLFSWYLPIETW